MISKEVQFVVCNIWYWLSPRRKEQCEKALKNYVNRAGITDG